MKRTATQISVRFVCVYASSTLPFNAVSNRFSRCLEHCFRLLLSLETAIYFNRFQDTAVLKTLQYKDTAVLTIVKLFCNLNFYLLPFLASVSRLHGPFEYSSSLEV